MNFPVEHQVECPVKHMFSPGLYAREVFVPVGTFCIGKLHRGPSVHVVSQGSMRVLTEQGLNVVTAPCTFVAEGGTKRMGYATENTVWTTVHATNTTDLAELEEELIAEDYSDIELSTQYRVLQEAACLS